jgi:O-antigen/teichoic acid export membrane protein
MFSIVSIIHHEKQWGFYMRKIRSDVVRDSINTFSTNAIGAVLTLIQAFAVLRRVDPVVKGNFNAFQTWSSGFSTIICLSITSSVIYFVARYKIQNTRGTIIKLTGIIAAAVVLLSTGVIALLRNTSFFNEMPFDFLAAVVLNAFLSLILNVCIGVLRGENKFKAFNLINLAQRVVVTILYVYIAFRPDATVWIWGTNVITFVTIFFALYGIRRWNGPRSQPAPEDDHAVTGGEMVVYSLKSHVSNILTYINTNLGAYIVQYQYTVSGLALFNTAQTIAQQLFILPDAVSQVIMSRIASTNSSEDKLRITVISSKVVALLTIVAAVMLYWISALLIPVIFPRYKGSLSPLAFLVVGCIFICYAKVLNNSVAAYGRPELNIIATACGVVTNCVSDLLLIPLMGMNGVALATALSMTVQGIVSIIIFCRYTKTPVYRLLVPTKNEIALAKGIFKK